jgi:hypothetical protein
MDLNITILAIVVIIGMLVLFFVLRKNRRDREDLEETIKKTELGVDHHKEERSDFQQSRSKTVPLFLRKRDCIPYARNRCLKSFYRSLMDRQRPC